MKQNLEFYHSVCNGCGKLSIAFGTRKDLIDSIVQREDNWKEIDGRLYCPDCYEYDEKTDEYKLKIDKL